MKLFLLACILFTITQTQCSPVQNEEFLDTSRTISDEEKRFREEQPSHTDNPMSMGEESDEDVPSKLAVKLTEQNNTQSLNKTSHNKNNRMTNWVNKLPKENNRTIDVTTIQLTTSQPQVVPLLETVATFRNSGSWTNGNKSFSVEVQMVATNVTQDSTNNTGDEANLKRNLTTASDAVTTEIAVNKDDTVIDSLEHNTEIYGKTAAEELAELSVIDILLRKRSVATTVKRLQPEFDDSDESKKSVEDETSESELSVTNINRYNDTIVNHMSVPNIEITNSTHNITQNIYLTESNQNSHDSSLQVNPFLLTKDENKLDKTNLTNTDNNTTQSTTDSHLLENLSQTKTEETDSENSTTITEEQITDAYTNKETLLAKQLNSVINERSLNENNTDVDTNLTHKTDFLHSNDTLNIKQSIIYTRSEDNITEIINTTQSHDGYNDTSQTTTEKKPIFAGFKSIADYIGFAL